MQALAHAPDLVASVKHPHRREILGSTNNGNPISWTGRTRVLLHAFGPGAAALHDAAVVTLDPGSDIPRQEHNGHAEAMTEVTKRLSALGEGVDRHERVIKRAIEIAGAFFQVEQQ